MFFRNRFINEEVIHSHQTRRRAVNVFCSALSFPFIHLLTLASAVSTAAAALAGDGGGGGCDDGY